MECNFFVGQKVVCVDGWVRKNGSGYADEVGPKKGIIYRIRDVGFLNPTNNNFYVRLFEVVNKTRDYQEVDMFEPCFLASRFRPIVTRKTDISIFTNMLRDVHADA